MSTHKHGSGSIDLTHAIGIFRVHVYKFATHLDPLARFHCRAIFSHSFRNPRHPVFHFQL